MGCEWRDAASPEARLRRILHLRAELRCEWAALITGLTLRMAECTQGCRCFHGDLSRMEEGAGLTACGLRCAPTPAGEAHAESPRDDPDPCTQAPSQPVLERSGLPRGPRRANTCSGLLRLASHLLGPPLFGWCGGAGQFVGLREGAECLGSAATSVAEGAAVLRNIETVLQALVPCKRSTYSRCLTEALVHLEVGRTSLLAGRAAASRVAVRLAGVCLAAAGLAKAEAGEGLVASFSMAPEEPLLDALLPEVVYAARAGPPLHRELAAIRLAGVVQPLGRATLRALLYDQDARVAAAALHGLVHSEALLRAETLANAWLEGPRRRQRELRPFGVMLLHRLAQQSEAVAIETLRLASGAHDWHDRHPHERAYAAELMAYLSG